MRERRSQETLPKASTMTLAKSRRAWRHHRPDRGATRERYEAGIYLSKDSFVDVYGREFLAGDDLKIRKERVLARDQFMCSVEGCGSRDMLQVHHIHPKGPPHLGSDDEENLETLCWRHHADRHLFIKWGARQ